MNDNQDAEHELEEDAQLGKFISEYLEGVRQEFEARWDVWPLALQNPGPSEVSVGLLRRQCSLLVHLAQCPLLWTAEFAPIVLRCMVEVYIWLAWILEDPAPRARKFIDDGLGKEKLIIKHRTDEMEHEGMNPDDDPLCLDSKAWLETQRFSFLVDVNLSASWSGLDTRKMAEECGCLDFYRFTYPTFSSAVHSTWNFISRFDLVPCRNPLHGFHRMPVMTFSPPSIEFFRLAGKYVAKTFKLVDSKLAIECAVPSTYNRLFPVYRDI